MKVTVVHSFDAETLHLMRRFDRLVVELLSMLINRKDDLMGVKEQLQEILADVREQKTQVAGVATLITGLRDQVAELLADKLSDEDKSALNEIFTTAEENRQSLANALNEGTTPTPPVEPAP